MTRIRTEINWFILENKMAHQGLHYIDLDIRNR